MMATTCNHNAGDPGTERYEMAQKPTPKKTPVRVMQAATTASIHAAQAQARPIPMAAPHQDPPMRMVQGRPGSDEALKETKRVLREAGLSVRSVAHTPAGDIVAYVYAPEDAPAQPKARPQRSSVPRRQTRVR